MSNGLGVMRKREMVVPRLSTAVMLASLSLANVTGCQMEAEAPEDSRREGQTDQAASALQVTYFDFIANAGGAAWHNSDGGLSFGTNDSRGSCYSASGVVETGASVPYLATTPKWTANGYVHAAYTVSIPPASQNPKVTATFGFAAWANSTDGMTFGLKAYVDGVWVPLFNHYKTWTGALTTKTVDLSAYGGRTLQLFLVADAAANYNYDFGAWTDLRIVADNIGTPADGCTINNVQYATGTVNPAVSCQVCDPISSASSWTIRADSCLIASTCYTAEQQDALKCRRCDPLTSQTSWTNKTQCDNLVIAVTNERTDGSWGRLFGPGRSYPDELCAAEGDALGLPGKWVAMYSDSYLGRNFKDVVPPMYASWTVVNLKGQQMYSDWTSIFTNQEWASAFRMYYFGDPSFPAGGISISTPWTGSNATGVWDASLQGGNCTYPGTPNQPWSDYFEWISLHAKVADHVNRKLVDSGYDQYSNYNATYCGTQRPFQCVLLPPGPQVTVQNYDGTALGTLRGKPHGDAYAYLGIPYAAAPTGNLRFAPPAKATSWTGVRTAQNQPPPCPQPPLLPLGGMIGSEDCLFLNVWSPKTATPTSALPVLVYQFGGGHIFGGTASADDWLAVGFLDGDRFAAAQNAIIVTIQTRSGALGWLTDPALAANATSRTSTVGGGTSGNYGLLDAIQSLKWVKKNISKFGGDPNKVTFFGESSGATIVCDLLASPLAKDPADNKPYFSSIIMESGFCENPLSTFRQTQATPIITSVGCASAPDKVACLRAASLQSFVNTEGAVLEFFPDMFGQTLPPEFAYGLKFGPHVDGYVLPTHPRQMFAAGTHNKVPTIVGTNKDEATFFMLFMVGGILTGDLPNLIVLLTCNDFINKTNINLGTTLATSARALYPCSASDALGPTKAYAEGITQLQYECPARRTARALDLGQTQNVYRYWFTHRGDNLGVFHNVLGLVRDVGASHTFEIPFVFNTHNTMLWYWPSSREKALTTAMQSYWRNFANSGNPNYTGGVTWPAYDRTIDNTLQLEVTGVNGGTKVVNGINTAKCDFWDDNFNLDGWK